MKAILKLIGLLAVFPFIVVGLFVLSFLEAGRHEW